MKNIKIYQIEDIMNTKYSFAPWFIAELYFDFEDYKLIYEGSSDTDDLDSIFTKFNQYVRDYYGHSLSVSDIVEVDGKRYYCDQIGWTEL